MSVDWTGMCLATEEKGLWVFLSFIALYEIYMYLHQAAINYIPVPFFAQELIYQEFFTQGDLVSQQMFKTCQYCCHGVQGALHVAFVWHCYCCVCVYVCLRACMRVCRMTWQHGHLVAAGVS